MDFFSTKVKIRRNAIVSSVHGRSDPGHFDSMTVAVFGILHL